MLGSAAKNEMRSLSTKALLTWLALAFQLTGAAIPATGLLLCFGADGHFDVEAPHHGRDCHAGAEDSRSSAGCRDIELSASHVAENPKAPVTASPSIVIVTIRSLRAQSSSPAPHTSPDSPAFDFRTREALRSVILLV
jgi:hypothetical protein